MDEWNRGLQKGPAKLILHPALPILFMHISFRQNKVPSTFLKNWQYCKQMSGISSSSNSMILSSFETFRVTFRPSTDSCRPYWEKIYCFLDRISTWIPIKKLTTLDTWFILASIRYIVKWRVWYMDHTIRKVWLYPCVESPSTTCLSTF